MVWITLSAHAVNSSSVISDTGFGGFAISTGSGMRPRVRQADRPDTANLVTFGAYVRCTKTERRSAVMSGSTEEAARCNR